MPHLTAEQLRKDWQTNPRWKGVERPYRAEDVVRLRGSIPIEYSIARLTADKLWKYLNEKPFVNALGALTGNQAMQQVKAGLDAKVLIDIINAGSGRNSATQDKFPRSILPGTFDFGFATGLSYKDVRLCVDEAEALGVPMVAGEARKSIGSVPMSRLIMVIDNVP